MGVIPNASKYKLKSLETTADLDNMKKEDTKELSIILWNARALTFPKIYTLKMREEDVLIVNETWGHHPELSLYQCFFKSRVDSRGGGVAIYVKLNLYCVEILTDIEDTMAIKVSFERSKMLYIISSYFPNTKAGRTKRWKQLQELAKRLVGKSHLENLIFACDWNMNIEEDKTFTESLLPLGLKIPPHPHHWTYSSGDKKSKLDFVVVSQNVETSTVQSFRSLSDHVLLALTVTSTQEIPRSRNFLMNRKLAMRATGYALSKLKFTSTATDFFNLHFSYVSNNKQYKWIELKPNNVFKKDLKVLLDKNHYDTELFQKEMLKRWSEIWMEVNKIRFSDKQKQAFKLIRKLTKYQNWDKKDNSIVTCLKVGEENISNPVEVNYLLRQMMNSLGGNTNIPDTYCLFPNLEPIDVYHLHDLINELSGSKAVASDFIEDETLFNGIANLPYVPHIFSNIWNDKLNSKIMKSYLTGRLIPINKVAPLTPNIDEIRPIIALSPIVKILEARFKSKLDNYQVTRLMVSQTGFVKNCGTQVNLVRLIQRGINCKNNKKIAAILFIDLKQAYNHVNQEKLFYLLRHNRILEEEEIQFLRALYANTYISIGRYKVRMSKGVMQGSTISPALFNIFLEPLLETLSMRISPEDLFVYADDIAILIYSTEELDYAINTIKTWSRDNEVPINYIKSGILNIKLRKGSPTLTNLKCYKDFPVVTGYKYLGVWLNEYLDPCFHLDSTRKKITYITNRIKTIPKKSITPKLLINLWTVLVRPNFDYGLSLVWFGLKSKQKRYYASILQSFKSLLNLRSTIANRTIIQLMGYDPNKFAEYIVNSSRIKWNNRINREVEEPVPTPEASYGYKGDNILISWALLNSLNLMFHSCGKHPDQLITEDHLIEYHGLNKMPDIECLLQIGAKFALRLKTRRRKKRIWKAISKLLEHQERYFNKLCDSISTL